MENSGKENLKIPPEGINLYKETQEEFKEKILQDSEVDLFTSEERALGNKRSVETNKAKGRITKLLEVVENEFSKMAAVLERAEEFQDKSLKLFTTSRYLANRNRLTNALIDLASGVCIGTMKDENNSKKIVRVYTEKPSIEAFRMIERFMKAIEPNIPAKQNNKKSTKKKSGNSRIEDLLE